MLGSIILSWEMNGLRFRINKPLTLETNVKGSCRQICLKNEQTRKYHVKNQLNLLCKLDHFSGGLEKQKGSRVVQRQRAISFFLTRCNLIAMNSNKSVIREQTIQTREDWRNLPNGVDKQVNKVAVLLHWHLWSSTPNFGVTPFHQPSF